MATGRAPAAGAPLLPPSDPLQHFEFDYESGVLWRAGHNGSRLNYILRPQLLTLKTPPVKVMPWLGGDLVLRSRFTLLVEPIVKGPEHHYFGGAASGILEWWDQARTRSLFFTSGGGFGVLDSKGRQVPGAQGQDFNFNWFIYSGARFPCGGSFTASLGLYFQHVSNGGMSHINPGLDALGPIVSVGRRF